MDFTLRAATDADIDEVLRLWEVAAAEPSVTDDGDGVAALLARDPQALLLAVDSEGRIVGTLIAGWDGWRAGLYRLAVHPECRRRGVATELLAEGERRLRALGARKIQGIVLAENSVGREFWQSAGYPHDGRAVRHVKIVP
ncbi:MAG: GNAT family N-acetyltransferase [Actinobacteria bacterium]|nr:GNAT family N-acetyltransferase [Actinomycetota bacterium]